MKRITWILLLSFFVLGSIGDCFAITYTEAIDGDLDWPVNLVLDTPSNIVAGSIYWNAVDLLTIPVTYDQDNFGFKIEKGKALKSIELIWQATSIQGPMDQYNTIGWNIWSDQEGTFWNIVTTTADPAGSTLWIPTIMLGEGQYYIMQGGSVGQDSWFKVDYSLELKTGPAVPIPGAIWLLGSGLIGLAGFGSRKK